MSAFNVTKENFKTEVLEAKTPVLVDFWAPWCGYCRRIGPAVDALAAEYAGKVAVGKVNVDEQPELAEQFKVMTIPSLFVFQNGEHGRSHHRTGLQGADRGIHAGAGRAVTG